MIVVLLGYRGSGKTTVGRLLAARLGAAFVDTDQELAMRLKMPIRKIFETEGEDVFRAHEEVEVERAMQLRQAVVALGGGGVLREKNRAALRESAAHRVYLRCDEQILDQRIRSDATTMDGRPALTSLGGGLAEIRQLLTVREPIYRELATCEVDVSRLSVEEATTRSLEAIERGMPRD